MSKQRLVDTCFWDDGYIMRLDPSEKLLFLYLLTNPLTAICGVYQIELRRIAFDTGFEMDTVKRMLDRFERDGRCLYRDGWVAMKNWLKHQNPGSIKVQKGIELQLEKVPVTMADYIGKGIDTLSHLNLNTNTNPNTNNPPDTISKKPAKKEYAEAVQLTDEEWAKLEVRYGKSTAQKLVDTLSNAKLAKGYKYKSDYHAILKWVVKDCRAEELAAKKPKGWACKKCGYDNTHTGSFCLKCKEER